ncbi:MAG: hypothetical protein FRX49_05756 [Trebouxia sp. A1-2]|nr:MAG: hypothetical protein FRX49_05756 [Trebouxia sp. A1-2]
MLLTREYDAELRPGASNPDFSSGKELRPGLCSEAGKNGLKSSNLYSSSHFFPVSEYRPGRSSSSRSLVKSSSTVAGAICRLCKILAQDEAP